MLPWLHYCCQWAAQKCVRCFHICFHISLRLIGLIYWIFVHNGNVDKMCKGLYITCVHFTLPKKLALESSCHPWWDIDLWPFCTGAAGCAKAWALASGRQPHMIQMLPGVYPSLACCSFMCLGMHRHTHMTGNNLIPISVPLLCICVSYSHV